MFKCTDCGQNFKSQNTLENHVDREHKMQGIDNDKECPICGKVFITKETMQDHFKESHMNPIDIRKNQTLSDLITDEAKEIVIDSKTEEMTLEEYDKVLDKYEALYCTEDEDSENDIRKT